MDILFENFKELTNSPKNAEQLKKLVLQLAVQGKLTAKWRQENPDVEPAKVLLERIQAEKEQMIKQGKIKRAKPLPGISEEEKPFDLPEGWEWCRLTDIAEIIMGQSPPSESYNEIKEGLPFYQGKKEFGKMYLEGVSIWCSNPKVISEINDILISVRAPVGDVNIAKEPVSIGRGLSIIRLIDKELLFYIFYFLDHFKKIWITKGSFFDSINKNNVLSVVIPIPPPPEQQAITKKTTRLMSLCDELEKKAEEREALHEKVMQAVVKQFTADNTTTPLCKFLYS
ncbi:Restriction endonuclease, type I [Desulfonema limicola]|uniref:Restriction endonuclease, type I n=1 Tax=Desulfonema limicola TaxID=45656 RepID=A0A975GGG5_9BACT|nr:restriction endonuclease subunit S [Desulfonema limicola]QTA80233.1 Restriction endonuclease, type I [Desulfonema limicola]